jgi:hypothetical protein
MHCIFACQKTPYAYYEGKRGREKVRTKSLLVLICMLCRPCLQDCGAVVAAAVLIRRLRRRRLPHRRGAGEERGRVVAGHHDEHPGHRRVLPVQRRQHAHGHDPLALASAGRGLLLAAGAEEHGQRHGDERHHRREADEQVRRRRRPERRGLGVAEVRMRLHRRGRGAAAVLHRHGESCHPHAA